VESEKIFPNEARKKLYPNGKNRVGQIVSDHFDDGIFYPKITFNDYGLSIKFRENISPEDFIQLRYWDYLKNVLMDLGVLDSKTETIINNI
jgi:hypothetical protein